MRQILLFCLSLGVVVADLPQQIHLSFQGLDRAGNSNGMSVTWVTFNTSAAPTVRYGTVSGQYAFVATGRSHKYLNNSYGHFDHTAALQNLLPNTRYYYVCGDQFTGEFSPEWSFKSAPLETNTSFQFSIFGDFGYGKNGNAILTRARLESIKDQVDFMMHVGDISYADDAFLHTPFSFEYEQVYNAYMADLQNITATKAYMVLPGNHEAECHSPDCLLDPTLRESLRNYSAYNSRFAMPFAESRATCNMWYSFNYGNVHFVSFNTETDFTDAPGESFPGESRGVLPAGHFAPDGAQVRWLQQDLAEAQANRKVRPWVIAMGHRPMYTRTVAKPVQQTAIEGLLKKYGVDLYITGHDHSYTRTWPTFNSTVTSRSYQNPPDTVHLIVGGAGCDEMSSGKARAAQPYVAFTDDRYATGIVRVKNNTHLQFDLILSVNGAVADSITLVKN